MILRDRDVTVDPCCDNLVGLVLKGMRDTGKILLKCQQYSAFFKKKLISVTLNQPLFSSSVSSISTIMAETQQEHQRDVRDECVNKFFFFLTERVTKNFDAQGEISFSVFCHSP